MIANWKHEFNIFIYNQSPVQKHEVKLQCFQNAILDSY